MTPRKRRYPPMYDLFYNSMHTPPKWFATPNTRVRERARGVLRVLFVLENQIGLLERYVCEREREVQRVARSKDGGGRRETRQ